MVILIIIQKTNFLKIIYLLFINIKIIKLLILITIKIIKIE